MNKNLTELVFIVDRSGSMVIIASEMEEAIKSVLSKQKSVSRGEIKVTFVRFDSEYEEVFSRKPISEVKKIKIEPRGSTALLDAIGKTINTFENRFMSQEENEKADTVLFIIITDGQENSSLEYDRKEIFKIVEKSKEDNNWGFVFIGANQDKMQ